MVHGILLGHQFMRVWVDVAKAPGAYLFCPNHEIFPIGEVVGSTVAWPTEKVVARATNGGIYDTLVWNEEGFSRIVLGLLDILLVNYDFDFYFLLILDLYFGL